MIRINAVGSVVYLDFGNEDVDDILKFIKERGFPWVVADTIFATVRGSILGDRGWIEWRKHGGRWSASAWSADI